MFESLFQRGNPLSLSLVRISSFLALSLLLAAGCGGARRATGSYRPATKVRPPAELLAKIKANEHPEVFALSAKARVYTENEAGAINASANILWLRDSVVWITVRKFGVEAVRALITPDSAFILYRLEQQYAARSLSEIKRQYGLPEGFDLLQRLLLGDAWLPADVAFQSDIRDSLHCLRGVSPRFALEYRVEEGSFGLRQARFLQQQEARSLALDFDRFEKLSGIGQFPYLRRIEAHSPEEGALRVEIEFTEIEVNVSRSYRFEIPAHYQRTR
ncbi:MAG: hypothetical protein RL742_37 [Bacteroidota bacterium]|jgi:hypothetical protein